MASIVIDLLPTPIPSIGQTIVVILSDRRLELDRVLLPSKIGSMRIARDAGNPRAKRKYVVKVHVLSPVVFLLERVDFGSMPPFFFSYLHCHHSECCGSCFGIGPKRRDRTASREFLEREAVAHLLVGELARDVGGALRRASSVALSDRPGPADRHWAAPA